MSQTRTTLPHVLSGERHEISDPEAGLISYYLDGPAGGSTQPPMLLIHSINATPSAHEVKPLFDAYKLKRPTYAIDLPGYGHSERSERLYNQALMVKAVMAMLDRIRSDHPGQAVDALAVSLSSEFLAKAAVQAPHAIRSLALVSPTGFARITRTHGPAEADLGKPGVYRAISAPGVGQTLYKLLTVHPSIRFFLKKTFGREQIDEEMFEHACRLSRTPNAHRTPLCFIGGFLFSADIRSVFQAVRQPVWLVHGTRGDFSDFSRKQGIADQANWRVTEFETGAMPYFEIPQAFLAAYDDFLAAVESGGSIKGTSAD